MEIVTGWAILALCSFVVPAVIVLFALDVLARRRERHASGFLEND
jgi:hypothetical protein